MTGSGAELIRQMVAGDREAFARFYDRYAPLVFPLIQRILRERADASDVLQEVFWEAWKAALPARARGAGGGRRAPNRTPGPSAPLGAPYARGAPGGGGPGEFGPPPARGWARCGVPRREP